MFVKVDPATCFMSSAVCGLSCAPGMHKGSGQGCTQLGRSFEVEWLDTLVTSFHLCFSRYVCYDPICYGLFAD